MWFLTSCDVTEDGTTSLVEMTRAVLFWFCLWNYESGLIGRERGVRPSPLNLYNDRSEVWYGFEYCTNEVVLYYSPSLHTSASVGRKLSKTDKRDHSDCELCAQVAMMWGWHRIHSQYDFMQHKRPSLVNTCSMRLILLSSISVLKNNSNSPIYWFKMTLCNWKITIKYIQTNYLRVFAEERVQMISINLTTIM